MLKGFVRLMRRFRDWVPGGYRPERRYMRG